MTGQSATNECKQSGTHFVGPVKILEDPQHWLPLGEKSDQVRDTLEYQTDVGRTRLPIGRCLHLGQQSCELGTQRRRESRE